MATKARFTTASKTATAPSRSTAAPAASIAATTPAASCPIDVEWFHKTVIADGPHMAVWVNGYQVTDWTDTRKPDKNPRNGLRLEKGSLQIQGHDPTTNLSFRNLKAKEIAK